MQSRTGMVTGARALGGFDSPTRALVHKIHRFVHAPKDDRFAYWRSLAVLWELPAAIVNVEWDNECSEALVAELLTCPQPLCTHAYRMHTPRSYWAHGWAPADARRERGEGVEWIGHGEEWAGYSAIGFCKVTPEARTAPLTRVEWPAVELAVNNATTGLWHVHWPAIEHYHKEPRCVPESAVS